MRILPMLLFVVPPSFADGACAAEDWRLELVAVLPEGTPEADRWPEAMSLSPGSYGDGVYADPPIDYVGLPISTTHTPDQQRGCRTVYGSCTHRVDLGTVSVYIGDGDDLLGTITTAEDEDGETVTVSYEVDGAEITVLYARVE